MWTGPRGLAMILFLEVLSVRSGTVPGNNQRVSPGRGEIVLFGRTFGVELASMLLFPAS